MPALALGEHVAGPEGRVRMTLPRRVGAPLLARAAVEDFASESSPELRRNTQLVVTELVTNALRHGRGRISLCLARGPRGRLTGEVLDGGDGFEIPSEPPAGMQPGGWGLWIVNDLAERWGLA